jgi:UDP-N-acetylmuramyl pentapeptide phosphotransferase/UDP-N-acetylglucosamine-1-phosphate transferase
MFQITVLTFLLIISSYLAVAGLRWWAEQREILDIPNGRSSHTHPTPRGGGLAIVLLTLTGWLLYTFSSTELSWLAIFTYTIGAALIATISWWDDLHSLSNRVRFMTHSIGALLALIGFGYWQTIEVPLLGSLHLSWVGLPLTFLWIVGLTNAYNFMDGIDGIAGSQAVVAGLGWMLIGWQIGQPLVGIFGLLIAASSQGFLGHNWSPARIFMGDVGSAFLGYTFAVLPLIVAQVDPRIAVAGVLLLWPFLFDTIFTFLCRWYRGENVFVAHRSHLYQRLVIVGFSHRTVTLLYTALALTGIGTAYFFVRRVFVADWLIMVGVPIGMMTLWFFVRYQERLKKQREEQLKKLSKSVESLELLRQPNHGRIFGS